MVRSIMRGPCGGLGASRPGVGRTHAGKTVTIVVEDTHLRVLHNGEELSLHPRTTTTPVTRFWAYAPRQPGE